MPIRTPARKLMATPTPDVGATPLYQLPSEQSNAGLGSDMPPTPANLPFVKPEDYQYFAPLLKEDEEIEDMTAEEAREQERVHSAELVRDGVEEAARCAEERAHREERPQRHARRESR